MTLPLHFDGTLEPLLQYVRHIESCHGPRGRNKERLLLNAGRSFASQALTSGEYALVERAARVVGCEVNEFERKQCFYNSQMLAASDFSRQLTYVEGYAWPEGGIPVHHGWVVINDKVVDLTLRDNRGEPIVGTFDDRVYLGVAFATACLVPRMLATATTDALLEEPHLLKVDEAHVVTEIELPERCRGVSRLER